VTASAARRSRLDEAAGEGGPCLAAQSPPSSTPASTTSPRPPASRLAYRIVCPAASKSTAEPTDESCLLFCARRGVKFWYACLNSMRLRLVDYARVIYKCKSCTDLADFGTASAFKEKRAKNIKKRFQPTEETLSEPNMSFLESTDFFLLGANCFWSFVLYKTFHSSILMIIFYTPTRLLIEKQILNTHEINIHICEWIVIVS